MNKSPVPRTARIYLAGHNGLVGSALLRDLAARGFVHVVTRSSDDLDLTSQSAVDGFFASERPEVVILAAAKVGGIYANNTYPADFIRDNLLIQTNVIDAAFRNDTKKFVFLGSSCIYPKHAPQPIRESSLLTAALESTNEAYAIAKIAGLKMCQAYRRQHGFDAISLMPTNLYGPNDNFDPLNSHVMPALIRRFHEATMSGSKSVSIWGTGTPKREFLHVDDLADAVLFLLDRYSGLDPINVGTGSDITIAALAKLIGDVVGFNGTIAFDPSKPDGTPRKVLDTSAMKMLGWQPSISLFEGVRRTYEWYCAQHGAPPPIARASQPRATEWSNAATW